MARVMVVAALALVSACSVGDGAGQANGLLFVVACGVNGENYGTPESPKEFRLSPEFFAGEPIEDIGEGPRTNRLLIRMQRSGNRIEVSDILYFDVQNAYEIARCVRGGTANAPEALDFCDWSDVPPAESTLPGCQPAAPGMRARIRINDVGKMRSSLSPLFTCNTARTVAVAVEGWIDFIAFGRATQPDKAPELRDPVAHDFKVDFGERLSANFHLVLRDQAVVTAEREMDPVPEERIGGVLDGCFDFELERGRAAQPFP
jgi:hypothetical protein